MSNIHNLISFYKKASDTASAETIPLDIFLDNIRSGAYEDFVHPVRRLTDKKEREAAKKKVPAVTIAGTFSERTDNGLEKHSGFIAIDIDHVEDPTELKSQLCVDRHVAAAFVSISGRGLCLLFRVKPDKHREAFAGLCEYLFKQYQVICDPTSINPSRLRFVSYDPYIYINERSDTFTLYPKEKEPKHVDKVIYTADDFSEILKQIVERQLNVTQDSYHIWLRLAFAIVSKFGEAGRQYFHVVSQFSSKYDPHITDKQYDACMRHKSNSGRLANISTFYYYCKEVGVSLYTERTKLIAYSTTQGKKAGLSPDQIADNLAKLEGITGAEETIAQIYNSNIEIDEDTLLHQMEIWMRQNYNLRRNEITRYIENNGAPLQQTELNSIFIKAKKIFDKVSYELMDRLINSDFVPTYNPFLQWFQAKAEQKEAAVNPSLISPLSVTRAEVLEVVPNAAPLITQLFGSVQGKDPEYNLYFGTKWIVGAVAAVHGEHSPLMLVLSGDIQNTGKTEFFRRLLPVELLSYYAESKLDAGKDDEILMTQKWLIMDDEMGGKSKKEVKRLKELTSKATFSLREPYGRNNVDLKRIAVLCGTTNDNEILSDPTGNRRIIPIHVFGIEHTVYNSIDKDELWWEAYQLWSSGFNWKMTRADIDYLAQGTGEFEMSIAEAELIMAYFKPGNDAEVTATDVKVEIEKNTNQRLSLDRIGKDLKRLGFEQKHIKSNGTTRRVYCVTFLKRRNEFAAPERPDDDLPF